MSKKGGKKKGGGKIYKKIFSLLNGNYFNFNL